MKYRFLSIMILAAVFLGSCKKESLEYRSDFDKSYQTWLQFKAASGNSYEYQSVSYSWVGYTRFITVTVKNGIIVQRSLNYAFDPDYQGPLSTADDWVEKEGEIDKHGGLTLPMDEIYAECRDNWLKKRSDAKTFFEVDSRGLIRLCGYVPENCVDDCFQGVSISYIRSLAEIP